MSWLRDRFASRLGLPAAENAIRTERDLRIPMRDGAVLLADRWYPVDDERAPLVICRTPYGRYPEPREAALFAERGMQMLVVSCRGTFGSEGTWAPFVDEAGDGRDTLGWIEQQPWFPGAAVLAGASYSGITQWAVASDAPEWVVGYCMAVTTRSMYDGVIYPRGAFSLDTALTWLYGIEHQETNRWLRLARGFTITAPLVRRAASVLPIGGADRKLVGHQIDCYQDWLAHPDADDPWWRPLDFTPALEGMRPLVMTSGWYDLFLEAQLRDVVALQAAGVPVRMAVGPWQHSSPGLAAETIRQWLDFARARLGSEPAPEPETCFTVQVMGSGERREYSQWPPPFAGQTWFLHGDERLRLQPPSHDATTTYDYNPLDPTPNCGGRTLNSFNGAAKDQRIREQRDDVLIWTSPPMTSDHTVIGTVEVELRIASDLADVDYFVRLCDVSPRGRSRNITDGLIRRCPSSPLDEGDGAATIRLTLAPTAHCFRAGHAIRLQVSSGAHPIVARNLGTGEPVGTSETARTSHHVLHVLGSKLTVPVVD
ncbi:CocE/NonD family hydrolase [Flexivirga sp. ID2601S]|uniref:CocE/NonD family hydrolase n=1 Tax=Flexivirga aerilata TaxID=1656889 RepID=A0A849AEM1_9MICO|nr:CocE/NonD family hydrolase [Flexivirga aerilata]NNG38263.1 CocE/NonD family hydrolase [Flexivirga aerilata]